MEYGRARRWSRAVAGLFLAKPEDFIQCWEDQRMSKALSVFLLLRRYARAHFPQDAVSAYGLALQLPVGPEAWGSQAQHHFVDCLLRLLHRALIHLYGAGGGTNVEYLHQTVQIARLTLDHFPLGRDNRIVFLMARSRVLQMWFQRTADVDSLCLSIALSRQLQVVAPTLNYPACRAHTLEYWNMGCSIAGPHVSIMDAVIALLRDLLQRCPLEHPLTSGLGDNLAQMMRMRCALPHESSLLDEMIAVNKQSLMGKSSTEPATIDSYMSLSLLVLGLVQKNSNYDPFPHAINLWEEALQGCPHDHHFRPALSHEAGSVFLARYERDGDVALLRRAVQLRRQAIACFTGDDNMRAQMCASLGDLLDRSFLREGSIADLHGRVEMYREVSRLRPDGHPNRAHACNELAGALRAVFLRFGTASALQEAIDLYEEALSLASVGSPLHARSCTNLAGALCDQGTDLSHLQRASNLLQEVLCLRSGSDEDSFTRASAQCNLATLMTTLDRASGSYASEERCIALYQEALDAVPGDRSIRSAAYIGLLQRIHDRVHRTGDLALLDTAICHGREAVSLSFPREANYHVTLNTLAQALLMRHNFVGQTADLDEAISLERTLFSELPQAPSTRISACCTLATSLGLEFDRTGDTNRIDEAVSLLQEAYNICPEGSSQRASVCANYASHLARWFRATSSIAWLDRAIELSRQSLHLYVERQALRPGALHSLGSYLATRFGAVGDVASLDEAIQLFREALDLHPGDAQRADLCCNLGGNLLKRVIRTKDPSHLEETISLLKEACSDGGSRKASRYTLGRVCLARAYLVPNTPSFDPPAAVMMLREATDSIYNTRSLVNILEEMRLMTLPASHDLLGVMSNIVSNLPRLSNATMSFQTRLQALRFTDSIGMDSLYCAVQLGDIQTGVELMENSRAVFWSQALNMRDPQLEYLPSNLRIEIERLLGDLSSTPALMDGSQLTSRDVLHQQNERLQSLIAEARTLPGLAHFMLGTPYKELASGFTNTTVVMLSADTGGTRAIIMRGASSQPIHLQLDELPVDELKDLSTLLADLGMRLGRTGISPGDDERVLGASRRRDGGSKMERLLSKLWRKVMKPVLHSLNFHTKLEGRERPRLILCPTGSFTFAPLHAAGIYHGATSSRECVSDYAVCSYAPTLTSLLRARSGVTSRHPGDMSILAIAEGSSPGMPRLETVDLEVKSVCESAGKASLRVLSTRTTGTSTIQHAVSNFAGADIVHLACHGVQDVKDALQSGFCLSDGRLTVAELMKLKLQNPFLAFLSACETAKGDKDLPDQTVHLAAAMLFCGFQNVIGTMWSMGDEDGPTVARKVYATLFAQDIINAEDVPYALDAAVQDLRCAGLPPSRWATFIHLGA